MEASPTVRTHHFLGAPEDDERGGFEVLSDKAWTERSIMSGHSTYTLTQPCLLSTLRPIFALKNFNIAVNCQLLS